MINVTIIGGGRIGTMLSNLSKYSDYSVRVLHRGEQDLLADGPIIVCTRNDDLDGVMEWIPSERTSDLIFVQNGMLTSWFETHDLTTMTTALLYVAVGSVGSDPVDGQRTVVTGPNAQVFQTLMETLGLQCRCISETEFNVEMVEKFLWNCIFGILCSVYQLSVGQIVESHRVELSDLTQELLWVCMTQLKFSMTKDERTSLEERLCAYSMSIYEYRGAVKEWPWRNGWLVNTHLPQPLHRTFLENAVPHLL